MTGHKQAVKAFAIMLVFFTIVIMVFFYTAPKNIPSSKRQEVKREGVAPTPVSWDAFGALTDESRVMVKIAGATVDAEIARSDAKRALGLSQRAPLAEGEGMLFVFDDPSILSFWNKDMRFPIDVLWLEHGVVAGISEGLPAFTEGAAPVIITSPAPAQAVLEVPEGFVKKYGITSNTTVTIYENK